MFSFVANAIYYTGSAVTSLVSITFRATSFYYIQYKSACKAKDVISFCHNSLANSNFDDLPAHKAALYLPLGAALTYSIAAGYYIALPFIVAKNTINFFRSPEDTLNQSKVDMIHWVYNIAAKKFLTETHIDKMDLLLNELANYDTKYLKGKYTDNEIKIIENYQILKDMDNDNKEAAVECFKLYKMYHNVPDLIKAVQESNLSKSQYYWITSPEAHNKDMLGIYLKHNSNALPKVISNIIAEYVCGESLPSFEQAQVMAIGEAAEVTEDNVAE
ncbi:hypothetical protein N9N97_01410 [Rickettsiaceae bacterium]|nr:hypothetical protein [Rickettsiaceae bacterium]